DEEIKPNKVSVSAEDMLSEEWEMGSSMEEHRWDFYVDIFAENDAIGLHLAGDVQDLVKGMMPDIGRSRPHLEVLDLRQATPSRLFFCQLEGVQLAKVRHWGHPWTQHWYTVLVEVVDYYSAGGDVLPEEPEEPEEEPYIFLGGAPGEVHELTILGGGPGEVHEITYIGGTP